MSNRINDETALTLLGEFSKTDTEAHNLLSHFMTAVTQKYPDYGDIDMILNKVHYYIEHRDV